MPASQDFRLFGEHGHKLTSKIRKESHTDYSTALSSRPGRKIRVTSVSSLWESYASLKIDNGECEMLAVLDPNRCLQEEAPPRRLPEAQHDSLCRSLFDFCSLVVFI